MAAGIGLPESWTFLLPLREEQSLAEYRAEYQVQSLRVPPLQDLGPPLRPAPEAPASAPETEWRVVQDDEHDHATGSASSTDLPPDWSISQRERIQIRIRDRLTQSRNHACCQYCGLTTAPQRRGDVSVAHTPAMCSYRPRE